MAPSRSSAACRVAALGPLLLAGCYSTATLHTARPVAKGKTQAGVALGAFVGEDDGDRAALPSLEGQLRAGLADGVDAGLHASNFGLLRLDVNWAPILTERQAVSIDPTVEFSFGTYGWLPVLWDFHTSDDLTLTGSVRVGRYWLDLDNKDDGLLDEIKVDAWLYGAGLAASIRIGDSVRFVPEARVVWVDPENGGITGPPLVSLSLGLTF